MKDLHEAIERVKRQVAKRHKIAEASEPVLQKQSPTR
jgi:hypothetical protein